jgi:hypothetical protein
MGSLVAFERMTARLSDYRFWGMLLLAAGIYICANGLNRLIDSVEAFHDDYRKVNHLDDRDALRNVYSMLRTRQTAGLDRQGRTDHDRMSYRERTDGR